MAKRKRRGTRTPRRRAEVKGGYQEVAPLTSAITANWRDLAHVTSNLVGSGGKRGYDDLQAQVIALRTRVEQPIEKPTKRWKLDTGDVIIIILLVAGLLGVGPLSSCMSSKKEEPEQEQRQEQKPNIPPSGS